MPLTQSQLRVASETANDLHEGVMATQAIIHELRQASLRESTDMCFFQRPIYPIDNKPIRLQIGRRPVCLARTNQTQRVLTDTVVSISQWLSTRLSPVLNGMKSMSGHATISIDFGYLDLASTAPELLSEVVFAALVEAKKRDLLKMNKTLRAL